MPPKDIVDCVKQTDTDGDEVTIEFDPEMDIEDFRQRAIPFSVGYMGSTHGLTHVDYQGRAMTFKRHTDAENHG